MGIKKYRKKPIVVEAYQTQKELIIHTLEGILKQILVIISLRVSMEKNILANLIFLKRHMSHMKNKKTGGEPPALDKLS